MRQTTSLAALTAIVSLVATVTPYELFFLPVGALTWLFAMRVLHSDHRVRNACVMLAVASPVLLGALAAPVKYDDREHLTLSSECVATVELLGRLRVHGPRITNETSLLCFPNTTPTYREVLSRLEDSGIRLKSGLCGSGATLLFGAYPMRRTLVP